MGYDFDLDDRASTVHPLHEPDRSALAIDGRRVSAQLTPDLEPGTYFLDLDGRRERIYIAVRGDEQFIHYRGRSHRVLALNALEKARRAADPSGGAEILRAPMPGTVVEIAVSEGDAVEPGQVLLTIESMKLQTAVTTHHAARVAEVCVAPGASFDQGDALIRLEAEDTDDESAGESAASESATQETQGEEGGPS